MILKVENGSFAYPKGSKLLRDVDLELREGESLDRVLSLLSAGGIKIKEVYK